VSTLSWAASLPYQQLARLAQVRRSGWPTLQRPSVSIGNLAFGGRGKTPVTAALAKQAQARGLRPAILSRGYGGKLRRADAPRVLQGKEGTPWLQDVVKNRTLCGEEACWLAAKCPGVPVGVHRDRVRAAGVVLQQIEADLFLLDDGFQTKLQRDIDLVLLDAALDPPFSRSGAALRESIDALHRAQVVGVFGLPENDPHSVEGETKRRMPPQVHLHRLQRRATQLRRLSDGSGVPRTNWPDEVWVAAAVGQPESVVKLLAASGITSRERMFLRDHSQPNSRQIERLKNAPLPIVITEKDAVSWGTRRLQEALVLELSIDGADTLADLLLARLFQ
jgi:tetraacyldisaccharide 4'-kinase